MKINTYSLSGSVCSHVHGLLTLDRVVRIRFIVFLVIILVVLRPVIKLSGFFTSDHVMSTGYLILLAAYDELGPDRRLEQPLFVVLPELTLVTLSVLCWDGGCLKGRMAFVRICFDQGTAHARRS